MSLNTEVINSINTQFNKNSEFFKNHFPNLYNKWISSKTNKASIFINNIGELNFKFNNFIGYPISSKEYAKHILNKFTENSYKVAIIPNKPGEPDILLNQYLNKIYELIPQELKVYKDDTQIAFKADFISVDRDKKIYRDNIIPFLILIGVGLGDYINELLKTYDIRHLMLFEPNLDIFYLSWYTFDWENLFNYFNRDKRQFHLYVGTDVLTLLGNIQNLQPTFLGISQIYQHYAYKKDTTLREILRKLYLILHGLGFYDDEKWSLQHTVGNIKNNIPVYVGGSPLEQDIPVFIIGAGPSLDNSIEVIKKYKDKAIIFSCGSALCTLYKHNIVPDFHVEIERTDETTYFLKTFPLDYLKKISFLGTNTLPPETYLLFNERFMFLKSDDASVHLFPPFVKKLYSSNPSVVNGGIAMASELGAKNIYLFGVDLGCKDPTYHHAKDNIAFDSDNRMYKDFKITDKLEANFGGEVYTDTFLKWVKEVIESQIEVKDIQFLTEEFGGKIKSIKTPINVYNCSDGAKINNTIPLNPHNLYLEQDIDKEKVIKNIKSNFKKDYVNKEQLNEVVVNYYNEAVKLIDTLINLINKPINDYIELIEIFYEMYYEVTNVVLLRGTIAHFQSLILYSSIMDNDKERSINFINQALIVFKEFLEAIKIDLKVDWLDRVNEF